VGRVRDDPGKLPDRSPGYEPDSGLCRRRRQPVSVDEPGSVDELLAVATRENRITMEPWKWTWKNVDLPTDIADNLAMRFEADVYGQAVRQTDWDSATAQDIGLLVKLGNLYSRLELVRKGLEVDRLLVRLNPEEPIYHYNLACSHSLLGEIDQAFEALSEAVSLGYDNLPFLRQDRDLTNLKCDDRFDELLQHLESSRESS